MSSQFKFSVPALNPPSILKMFRKCAYYRSALLSIIVHRFYIQFIKKTPGRDDDLICQKKTTLFPPLASCQQRPASQTGVRTTQTH